MNQRICTVEGCEKPHDSRGFCMAHYLARRRSGDLQLLDPGRRHTITNANRETQIGDCTACGLGVPIVPTRKVPMCFPHVEEIKAQKRKRYREKGGREYHREVGRHWQHGLQKGGVDKLMAAAESRCQICETPLTRSSAHIDHDHACCPMGVIPRCGKCIRGILCSSCNTGLGLFRDNPKLLRLAIAYLDQALPIVA